METTTTTAPPRLRRVLTIWDLVFYGIILIQPIAPVGIFGITQKLSQGHMSTAVLAAMVAMMLTAFSYGRMAAVYPSAGSAYTYVSRALHPHIGSLIGWAMVLDYLVIPIVNVIYPALTFKRLFPQVPYVVWAALVTGAIIFLNLRGIRSTARANEVLLVLESLVVIGFLIGAVHYLLHQVLDWYPLRCPMFERIEYRNLNSARKKRITSRRFPRYWQITATSRLGSAATGAAPTSSPSTSMATT